MCLVVIHYSEIGIKSKNRKMFEECLIRNIKNALGEGKVYRRFGRIVCETTKEEEKIKEILQKLPGIEYFSFSTKSGLELKEIESAILSILSGKKFNTFKIEASRSNKQYPLTSLELNKKLGEFVVKKTGKKVKLENPDVTVWVEVCEKECFIYTEKIKGIGGLPIGASGKLIALISGGIDSPVASFLMMKRGCEIVFLHFFNETIALPSTIPKVKKIVEVLTKIQLKSKLYLIPFSEIQREIIRKIPAKYRMLTYRRFMLKVANLIAKKEKAGGIVTGDSIGQVASQTLKNLHCIYQASTLPIFAPLIGMNKEEIIELAKKIKTFEYSILPAADCCSFMVAKHPETRADINTLLKLESGIKRSEKLIEKSIKECKKVIFKFSFPK